MNKGSDDAERVRLSYEELGRHQVDQALTEIKKQEKRAAAQAKAGVRDVRSRDGDDAEGRASLDVAHRLGRSHLWLTSSIRPAGTRVHVGPERVG